MRLVAVFALLACSGLCFAPQVRKPAATEFLMLRSTVADHRSLAAQYSRAKTIAERDAIADRLAELEDSLYWSSRVTVLSASNEMKELDPAKQEDKYKFVRLYYIHIASNTIVDKSMYCPITKFVAKDAPGHPASYEQWQAANDSLTAALDATYDRAVEAYQRCQ